MSSSALSEEIKERIESRIAAIMVETRIPGLSVALVRKNRVIYARGFGVRNLKDSLAATTQTLCGVGSCTKSFTALAIMQFAEEGKLSVQDPVSKYLPFKIGSKEDPITIQHLLSHSSGIPNLGIPDTVALRMYDMSGAWIPAGGFEDLTLHINGASQELSSKPSERFFYLNEGYSLLGEIIERISGIDYPSYVKERILRPLRMNRSTFLRDEFEKDPDIMTPYLALSKDGKMKITPAQHPFNRLICPAGGLISSVMESSNYLIGTMGNGVFEDTRVLDASLISEMHRIHVGTETMDEHRSLGSRGKEGYGYGWYILEDFRGIPPDMCSEPTSYVD